MNIKRLLAYAVSGKLTKDVCLPFMRKALFFCSVIFLIMVLAFSGPGCANIIPPAGGPKDSLPPILMEANPPDSTVNFKGREITLTFDEYVDLNDTRTNLLFTPLFQNNPVIEARLRTLTIKFREELEANTTYVLNFGNAIVDINERNVLRDFVYTFSTGPALDSLEISGKVMLAETGGIDTTLMVVLHRNLRDSSVVTDLPQYIVKLNREGEFRFRNLPADTFAIYVLGDAGLSRRYQNKNQLFAFSDEPVISGQSDSVELYAYRETRPDATSGSGAGPLGGRRTQAERLRYIQPAPLKELQGDFILSFPLPIRDFDSSKVHLTVDSTFTPVNYSVNLDTSATKLNFMSNWMENTRYNLVLEQDFASDSTGKQLLKTDTLVFTTKKITDYGDLVIRLVNVDPDRNPVLQFIQNNQVVFSRNISSGILTEELFLPGEYGLRILYDMNNNGIWDTGQFFGEKRQPEIVVPIERTITVKPDWDNEFDIGVSE